MEEIAEQSYDLMEAYMLARRKRMKNWKASQRQHEVQKNSRQLIN
jgi:hypothetical protein